MTNQTQKSSNFTAVVRDSVFSENLIDYAWKNRLTRPQLTRLALDEFAANHGIAAADAEASEGDAAQETLDIAAAPVTEAPARSRRA